MMKHVLHRGARVRTFVIVAGLAAVVSGCGFGGEHIDTRDPFQQLSDESPVRHRAEVDLYTKARNTCGTARNISNIQTRTGLDGARTFVHCKMPSFMAPLLLADPG